MNTKGAHIAGIAVAGFIGLGAWNAPGADLSSASPADALKNLKAPALSESPWAPPDLAGYASVLKGQAEPAADTGKDYELAGLIDLAERIHPETKVAWEQARQARVTRSVACQRPGLGASSRRRNSTNGSVIGRAMADHLLNLSDRLSGRPERALPDLPAVLAELEIAMATHVHAVTDTRVAAQIHARLELHQATVPLAMKLARLLAESTPL